MEKFKNILEAQKGMADSLIEIKEILARDLPNIREESRTVDLWFQTYGKNRSLDLTKEVLRDLEMKAIDAEIFMLSEQDKAKALSDTFC